MTTPKVLVHVVGGIAYITSSGVVDVAVVDEDNVKGGDEPVILRSAWKPLARKCFGNLDKRLVRFRSSAGL